MLYIFSCLGEQSKVEFPCVLLVVCPPQLTEFGMATLKDESPSLLLLRDLQRRGLPLQEFIQCLQRIGCQRALNEFVSASEHV